MRRLVPVLVSKKSLPKCVSSLIRLRVISLVFSSLSARNLRMTVRMMLIAQVSRSVR